MIFEFRRYFIKSGQMDACNKLMLDHVIPLLQAEGVTEVGYWTGVKDSREVYDYILGFKDDAHQKAVWQHIAANEGWQAVKKELGDKAPWEAIESNLWVATEYSAIK